MTTPYEKELDGKANNVDVSRIFAAEENFERAEIMIKARKYKEGLDLLDQAIALNADEAEFYAWRGYARFLLSKDRKASFEESAADCRHAIKKIERCLPAHLFLGHMAKVIGEVLDDLTGHDRVERANREEWCRVGTDVVHEGLVSVGHHGGDAVCLDIDTNAASRGGDDLAVQPVGLGLLGSPMVNASDVDDLPAATQLHDVCVTIGDRWCRGRREDFLAGPKDFRAIGVVGDLAPGHSGSPISRRGQARIRPW